MSRQTRFDWYWRWVFLAGVSLGWSSVGLAIDIPSPSASLVDEVLATKPSDPHQYDWRNDYLDVEATYGNVAEFNSFKSSYYGLGLTFPTGGGWILRVAARHVDTVSTASSQQLALTPFSQAAQPSRYELFAGAGYALLDGRSQTAFSPRITDINHALYVLLGLQYNLFSSSDPEPTPGMQAAYYNWVIETGFRWQIFLPHSLGLGFEWTYSFPLSKAASDLGSWQRFGGILSWSFAR